MQPFTGKLIWVFLIAGGLFIAGSIFVYYGMESGAWLLLATIGAGLIILPLWLRKLNRDKAKRMGTPLSALVPLYLLQDTLILRDTADTSGSYTAGGVDWLTAILVTVGLTVIIGGIWILKRKSGQRREYPDAPTSSLDYPPPSPPQNGPMQPYETTEEKRRKQRGKP